MEESGAGYVVNVADLATAEQAGTAVAEGARRVDLAAALSVLAGALPGSRSAALASRLGPVWTGRIAASATGLTAHAATLAATARDYGSIERRIAEALSSAGAAPGFTAAGAPGW